MGVQITNGCCDMRAVVFKVCDLAGDVLGAVGALNELEELVVAAEGEAAMVHRCCCGSNGGNGDLRVFVAKIVSTSEVVVPNVNGRTRWNMVHPEELDVG